MHTSTLDVIATRLLSNLTMNVIAGRCGVSGNETEAILRITNENKLWDFVRQTIKQITKFAQ